MKKKLQAMTIIEVLVYFALFGIIFIGIIAFMISVRNTNLNAERRNELAKNAIFVMNHLNNNFDQTNSVDTANSIFNNDNGKIVLNLASNTVEYYLINDRLYYKENGLEYNLSTDDFVLSKFYIEQVQNSKSELVGARFNITFQSTKSTSSKYNFQTSLLFK